MNCSQDNITRPGYAGLIARCTHLQRSIGVMFDVEIDEEGFSCNVPAEYRYFFVTSKTNTNFRLAASLNVWRRRRVYIEFNKANSLPPKFSND